MKVGTRGVLPLRPGCVQRDIRGACTMPAVRTAGAAARSGVTPWPDPFRRVSYRLLSRMNPRRALSTRRHVGLWPNSTTGRKAEAGK